MSADMLNLETALEDAQVSSPHALGRECAACFNRNLS